MPVLKLFTSFFGSPQEDGALPLKRKRSPEPLSSQNDEIVPDSEEEADELLLSGPRKSIACPGVILEVDLDNEANSRSVRRKTESVEPTTDGDRRTVRVDKEKKPSTSLHFPPNEVSPDQSLGGGSESVRRQDERRVELEGEVAALKEAVREKSKEMESIEEELADERKKRLLLEDRCSRFDEYYPKLQNFAEYAEGKIEELEQRCREAEDSLEKTKSLLQTRTEELTIAQTFMTTADKYSVAEVVRLTEQLSDDIFQTAALLADILIQEKQADPASDAEAIQAARKQVVERYGEELTARLAVDIAQDDTILFECLVQNSVAMWCQVVINAIALANHGTVDKALKAVWEQLVSSHELSIAKNWRAITSSRMGLDQVDTGMPARRIFQLMKTCGWKAEGVPGDKPPDLALERLSEIRAKALKIREMLNEGILSVEMEVFRVAEKAPYRSEGMQDAYETGKSPPPGRSADTVVTTTSLGLRRVKRVPIPSNPSKKGRSYDIVLKPKVLLLSALAAQPQPLTQTPEAPP
ncbi:hypothetical protein NMY22_g14894 [Coprinellus aureogranulatus]|nr:hypothetical protein NMY22_g14894 [Coprinellus aureogranulatus]